ncbi:MAG: hypothetical protein B6I25_05560 [Planctomycetales bacterium 4572_13]|nr:MAG: hypothetical protein B6I25_05560 [Planctomycetales bacterium 4572_13]
MERRHLACAAGPITLFAQTGSLRSIKVKRSPKGFNTIAGGETAGFEVSRASIALKGRYKGSLSVFSVVQKGEKRHHLGQVWRRLGAVWHRFGQGLQHKNTRKPYFQ